MVRIFLLLIFTISTFIGCASQQPFTPQAKQELIKQAHNGNKMALHKVCYGYHRGKGLPQDYGLALKWCNLAAEKNIPSSQTLLAEIYYLGLGVDKDYEKAFHWYKAAANHNHPHAQYMLGLMYLEGQGGVKVRKPRTAMSWLRKASAQGHVKARKKLNEVIKTIH